MFAVSARMKMTIYLKKEESIKVLKYMSQEFRLKNISETSNFFLEEIEQNELMSEKHKKVCTNRNYIE